MATTAQIRRRRRHSPPPPLEWRTLTHSRARMQLQRHTLVSNGGRGRRGGNPTPHCQPVDIVHPAALCQCLEINALLCIDFFFFEAASNVVDTDVDVNVGAFFPSRRLRRKSDVVVKERNVVSSRFLFRLLSFKKCFYLALPIFFTTNLNDQQIDYSKDPCKTILSYWWSSY